MATSRSQEIRVGVVTVLALVILIGGIIWGKGIGSIGVGSSERIIVMTFPSTPGLETGTPITLKGVRKGSVTALEVRENDVRVTGVITTNIPLRSDAIANLQILEVTGGKKIELVPGDSRELLADDAVIPGNVQGDFPTMLADAGEITARARIIMTRLDSTILVVNGMVGSPEFRRNLENTFSNLEESSNAARQIAVGNREVIERTIANLDAAVSELRGLVDRTRPAVDRTLIAAEGTMTDARTAIGHVDSTLYRVDTLLMRLDGIAMDIRQGQGAVSKLLYDEKFAAELEATLKAVRSLIRSVEREGLKTKINIGFGN